MPRNPRPPRQVLSGTPKAQGHTARTGQSRHLGQRPWAPAYDCSGQTTGPTQQGGGGHELAEGPGKREDLQTQFGEFWEQSLGSSPPHTAKAGRPHLGARTRLPEAKPTWKKDEPQKVPLK